MTASEFAFLALGLVLGVASGAAIVEVLRSRPASPPRVRVTVTPDVVPRRSATLATSPFADTSPARGGPADASPGSAPATAATPSAATPSAETTARPATIAGRRHGRAAPSAATLLGSRPLHSVAIAVQPEVARADTMLEALRAAEARAVRLLGNGASRSAGRSATAVAERPTGTERRAVDERSPARSRRSAATPTAGPQAESSRTPDEPQPDDAATHGRGAGADDPGPGPCADARRTADERCSIAATARDRATAAADRLRETQRAYDEHTERADRAASDADPVRVRAAKDAAQHTFRTARNRATSREALEAAARDWLAEINRINAESRGAAGVLVAERAAADALVAVLERLAVEADAARIAAEAADEGCVAAREALAACEEASFRGVTGSPSDTAPRPVEPGGGPGDAEHADDADRVAAAAAGGRPLVLALLRGDRAALARVGEAIGGEDAAARRKWTVEIGNLVEAIVARAIEASALDFPEAHPFWAPFTRAQCRDISGALASLGFRFDGLGGWVDDRVPSQRDLSLSVAYAGLDPMRIRRWPSEDEIQELYRDVVVAADEYLSDAAGGLSLGELVSVLGRRADPLTEVWNAWGRIRPVLLEPSG
ncbi:MAG TPA: hypothetical protein VFI28_00545 [Candidatus Limnocylindrales bacterium]|nr:hypothetical protein [Candidatus Limnocylindrales bacterium]